MRVLAHDRAVRVYTPKTPPPAGGPVVACLTGRGSRMTLLKTPAGFTSVGTVVLAGPIVAYLESTHGIDSGSTSLIVADITTRHILREDTVGGYGDAGILGYERVTDLVLASDGAVAWIEEHGRGLEGPPTALAVHVAGRTGAPTILDEGPTIDPHSLTLSGRTLTWTDAGVRRSAQLPS
jgi:hypothetical protein